LKKLMFDYTHKTVFGTWNPTFFLVLLPASFLSIRSNSAQSHIVIIVAEFKLLKRKRCRQFVAVIYNLLLLFLVKRLP
jgi:hypothetical protein